MPVLRSVVTFFGLLFIANPGAWGSAYKSPFLWRIETYPPSFIQGTVHLAHELLFDLHPAQIRALGYADALYAEAGANDEPLADYVHLYELPEPSTLETVLPSSTWQKLVYVTESLYPDIDLTELAKLQPWIVADQLRREYLASAGGGDLQQSPVLDEFFVLLALELGMETGALEKTSELLTVFNSIPARLHTADLEAILNAMIYQPTPSLEETGILDFLDLYLSGDEQQMSEAVGVSDNLTEDERIRSEYILYGRNTTMAARIDDLIRANATTSFFFTSGTAHLLGEQSIIEKLREKGYRVTRVHSDWFGLLMPDIAAGWRYSSWMGWVWAPEGSPWMYHMDHGWFYAHGDELSVWLYGVSDSRWFWTRYDWYPYVWDATGQNYEILN